jgi:hypothetical protein
MSLRDENTWGNSFYVHDLEWVVSRGHFLGFGFFLAVIWFVGLFWAVGGWGRDIECIYDTLIPVLLWNFFR